MSKCGFIGFGKKAKRTVTGPSNPNQMFLKKH